MITVGNLLKYMESGQAFSLKVISYDRKRKKGGEILEYREAQLVQAKGGGSQMPGRSRQLTKMESQVLQLRKKPNHRKWYTRNIRLLQNGHPTSIIKTIHPPLIIEFNSQKVVP